MATDSSENHDHDTIHGDDGSSPGDSREEPGALPPFTIPLADRTAPEYIYKSLRQNEIRVLQLEPYPYGRVSLQHYDLHSRDGYHALSYCWGDQQQTCEISIGHTRLCITLQLKAALDSLCEHLRHTKHRRLVRVWVDQICINQHDIEERNQQVQQMWQTFSLAKVVYAWLDDETLANDYANYTASEYYDTASGRHRKIPYAMQLLGRPYFSRTWIIPEILQATDLRFLYDNDVLLATDLQDMLKQLISIGWKYNSNKLVRIKQLLDVRRQLDLTRIFGRSMTEKCTFIATLEMLHNTRCTEIRDRIFAALSCPSVAGRRSMLRADYSLTRDELVVLVVAHFDRLSGHWNDRRIGEFSRTLTRSLTHDQEIHLTSSSIAKVAVSVLCCTNPWTIGQSLFLRSGTDVGVPGNYLKTFLLLKLGEDIARIVENAKDCSHTGDVWEEVDSALERRPL